MGVARSIPLQSWATWKRKNRPQISQLQDSTLGTIETIRPTMLAHGFAEIRDDRADDLSPKADALRLLAEHLEPERVAEAVYSVWRHSYGYCSEINVYYKVRDVAASERNERETFKENYESE